MKIIVNRGFNECLTSFFIFKNGQTIISCPSDKDFCVFTAIQNDLITVKFKSSWNLTFTVCSFICQEEKDLYYINPTKFCKRWEIANYRLFPYLCLLLLILCPILESAAFEWICAGMTALTAVSLMSLQFCMTISCMRKKLFRLNKIS